jgi:hypothetical protein
MKKDLKVNELWLLLSLVISTGSVVSGCGKDSTKSSLLGSSGGSLTGNVSLTCGASDQYDSYMMPIFTSAVPAEIRNSGIPVYIDHQFTSVQQQSLVKALQQWNTILLQKNGHRIFQIQTEPLMNGVMPETLADCSFGVSEYQYAILLTRDDAKWASYGMNSMTPAITIRCSDDTKVFKQATIINANLSPDDLIHSIALHEVGHAMGLDHSCTSEEGRDHYLNCSALSESHPYRKAIMYPSISEQASLNLDKQALNPNDQERAACILGF